MICTGSQKPGSSSACGSVLSQNDSVPFQFVVSYGMLRAAWKNTTGDFFAVKRSASPNRPAPFAS